MVEQPFNNIGLHASIPTDHFTDTTAGQLASLFAALSDPTRLRIIAALLDGEMNVGDLVAFIGLSKSAVSHQLRGLRDKRLVRSRKQGRLSARSVFLTCVNNHLDIRFSLLLLTCEFRQYFYACPPLNWI